MYCVNCGTEIKEENRFCPACGNKVEYRKSEPKNENAFSENVFAEEKGNGIDSGKENEILSNPVQMINTEEEKNSEQNYVNSAGKKKKQGMGEGILIVALVCLIGVLVAVAKHENSQNQDPIVGLHNDLIDGSKGESRGEELGQGENEDYQYEDDKARDVVNQVEDNPLETEQQHEYEIIVADVTWTEAYHKAQNTQGGYLVNIDSEEEWDTILQLILDKGYENKVFWIGAMRNEDSQEYHWIDEDGNSIGDSINSSSYWFAGEPSFYDAEHNNLEEKYVEMLYSQEQGRWIWNDAPNDLISVVPYYAGNVAYIVEIDSKKNIQEETEEKKELIVKTRKRYNGEYEPIYYVEYDENGDVIYVEESSYTDEEGNYHEKSIYKYEKEYDEKGKISRELEYKDNLLKEEYIYDENGFNMTKSYENGKLWKETIYTERAEVSVIRYYDENGKLYTEYQYEYNENGDSSVDRCYKEGELVSEDQYEYEYNENGDISIMRFYSEGELVSEDQYENGDISVERRYEYGILKFETQYEYEYNENGDISVERKYTNIYDSVERWYKEGELVFEDQYEYEYNENGDISITRFYSEGELVSENQYEYEYNENGDISAERRYEDGILEFEEIITYY